MRPSVGHWGGHTIGHVRKEWEMRLGTGQGADCGENKGQAGPCFLHDNKNDTNLPQKIYEYRNV